MPEGQRETDERQRCTDVDASPVDVPTQHRIEEGAGSDQQRYQEDGAASRTEPGALGSAMGSTPVE